MKILWLVLLLSGYAVSSESQALERQLQEYAAEAALAGDLEPFLTGDALESAQQSAQLIQDLGYRQQGRASFELHFAASGSARGCLDLSEVIFIDSRGAQVEIDREQRIEFDLDYDEDFRVSEIRLGEPC